MLIGRSAPRSHSHETIFRYVARKVPMLDNLLDWYNAKFAKTLEKPPLSSLDSPSVLTAFNPILSAVKAVAETFSPYYSLFDRFKDAASPVYALIKISKGMMNVILSPCIFLINNGKYLHQLCQDKDWKGFKKSLRRNAERSLSWMIYGVACISVGSTQLALLPLAYLVRLPLRLILSRKGMLTIENRLTTKAISLQSKLAQFANMDTKNAYRLQLEANSFNRQVRKALLRGEKSRQANFSKPSTIGLFQYRISPNYEEMVKDFRTAQNLQYYLEDFLDQETSEYSDEPPVITLKRMP